MPNRPGSTAKRWLFELRFAIREKIRMLTGGTIRP